ncbi:hypothetical protein ACNOYE_39285 [Nannocystaceae bacterium ST9]
MLRTSLLVSLVVLALSAACGGPGRGGLQWTSASPDPGVINLVPAYYAEGSGATDAVRAECDLEHVVPEWIARYTPTPVVLTEVPTGGARVLVLSITYVLAPGGGMWSGPKQLVIHGDLSEAGSVIASFDARRTTVTGGRAGAGGTCDVLDYLAEAVGKDVRAWLAQPSFNAPLGELR